MEVLRRSMRDRRRALDEATRSHAARSVARLALPLLDGVRTLGAYVAVGGEVDPAPIIEVAWQRGITVFVPRITAGYSMVFGEWKRDAPKRPGRFGVPEPDYDAVVRPASRLDAVLVPLVAFDRAGTRLGTGAGFYDRAFAFRLGQPRGSRPILVGLAYRWQESAHLERRPWDVPLDYVVTDGELVHCVATT
ncbi:MAG TPA: 5-formyltetrahydrofolate cyclo-ligase [Acidimicrobiales bacterium]